MAWPSLHCTYGNGMVWIVAIQSGRDRTQSLQKRWFGGIYGHMSRDPKTVGRGVSKLVSIVKTPSTQRKVAS